MDSIHAPLSLNARCYEMYRLFFCLCPQAPPLCFLWCRGRSALSDAPSLCALSPSVSGGSRALFASAAPLSGWVVLWSGHGELAFSLGNPQMSEFSQVFSSAGSVPPEGRSCPRGSLGREVAARMRSPPGWLPSLPSSRGPAELLCSWATRAQSPWKSKPVSPHTFLF